MLQDSVILLHDGQCLWRHLELCWQIHGRFLLINMTCLLPEFECLDIVFKTLKRRLKTVLKNYKFSCNFFFKLFFLKYVANSRLSTKLSNIGGKSGNVKARIWIYNSISVTGASDRESDLQQHSSGKITSIFFHNCTQTTYMFFCACPKQYLIQSMESVVKWSFCHPL